MRMAPGRARILASLDGACCWATAAAVGVSALVAFGSRWMLIEAISNLRWQLGIAIIPLGAWACLKRRRALAAGLLVLACWLLSFELVPALGSVPEPGGTSDVVIAEANILWFNRNEATVLDFLRREKPDVFGLEEVSPWWRDHVEGQITTHPHRVFWPARRNQWHEMTWGIALFSRWPLTRVRRVFLSRRGDRSLPVLEAVTRTRGGRELKLRVVHIPRPSLSIEEWKGRQEVFAGLARMDWSGDVVLLGDMNTTTSSPLLRDLLCTTVLRDTRRGRGMFQSWPQRLVPLGLGICIDQILIAGRLETVRRWGGPLGDSDHNAALSALRFVSQ